MNKEEFMSRLDKRLVGYKYLPNISTVYDSITAEVLEELNQILKEEGLDEVDSIDLIQ